MITFNGKEFRNLVEQVLKNQKDIESINDINRSLADYGIKIIGFFDTIEQAKEDLGDPYEGPYGNAVGIGVSAPYDFYIWTRANNISSEDYWQDVGTLAVMGPQGIQGPQGEQGDPGQPAKIFTGRNLPTVSGTENDIYLCVGGDTNLIGNVYKIKNGTWQLEGNIRGPQGVQGDKGWTGLRGEKGETGAQGPQGDPGGFIKIAGILDNSAQLDPPTVIRDLEVAYLVGENKELWMQVGTTYDNAVWTPMGPLNVATYVQVNGEFQNIWDADTKLDKVSIADGEYHVYACDDVGDQITLKVMEAVEDGTIPIRDGDGHINVPQWPDTPNQAASKAYVDGLIVDSETIKTYWEGPDLSLNLSADLVADIGRSLKMPVEAPQVNSLVRITLDGQQQLISQAQFCSADQLIYENKTAAFTVQKKVGFKYTCIPSNTNSTIAKAELSVTQAGSATPSTLSATWAEIVPISTSRLLINAFYAPSATSSTLTPITLLASSVVVNASTSSPVFVMKETLKQGMI